MTSWLFSPDLLTAHGFCLAWEPWLIWTHATADALIGIAYFTIPVALASYARQRADITLRPVLWLFAAFITLCGSGHFLDLMTLWIPVYRLEGLVKGATAIVSVVTAAAVWRLLPAALRLPSPAQMRAANDALRDREVQILSMSRIKEQLRNVVEASPTALVLAGEDGLIRMVNAQAERMFGYDRTELQGRELELLLPEECRGRHAELRTAFLTSMSARAMGPGRDLLGLRKDGTTFPLEIGLSPIRVDDRPSVLAGITDVTARKEAERATRARQDDLEQSNAELIQARIRAERMTRAKSGFLANMSHELRTPLNGVLGYAELLGMDGGLNAVQVTRLAAMQSAGQHLLEMINSVLDLSKIEAGEVTVNPVVTDLASLMQDCLDVVRPAAAARNLAVDLHVAADLPAHIIVDSSRLSQILLNLLGNAVKFTACGSIGLRACTRRERDGTPKLRIEIADTGRGIPKAQRVALFQEFERLGADTSSEGAGLGLAISAHLSRVMGGRLDHEDNPGGGSIFVVTLPLAGQMAPANPVSRQQDSARMAPKPPAPGGAAAGPSRILVVDDVAPNRDIASAFLRAAGHFVTCAEGGAEAVHLAAEAEWDIVLMDLRMPDMDGFEATRRIRALGGARGRVPILALTAHAFMEQIEACAGAGMIGHLAKPFSQASLLKAVQDGLKAAATEANTPLSNPGDSLRLPILDLGTFETTSGFLAPAKLVACLDSMVSHMQAFKDSLDEIGVSQRATDGTVELAHTVAGTVGTFGFVRLAAMARQFDRAAQADRDLPQGLTALLHAALDASLVAVQQRLAALRSSADDVMPPIAHLGASVSDGADGTVLLD